MGHPVIHFEIPADDLEKMEHFYGELFGWTMKAESAMPEYVMVETKTDGQGINGGVMKKHLPTQHPTNYVLVESVAEYAKKASELGGQIVVPKTPIPKMGYFAVTLDPEGNAIGLFEMDEDARVARVAVRSIVTRVMPRPPSSPRGRARQPPLRQFRGWVKMKRTAMTRLVLLAWLALCAAGLLATARANTGNLRPGPSHLRQTLRATDLYRGGDREFHMLFGLGAFDAAGRLR